MSRLRRFLHIERSRSGPPAPGAAAPGATAERIGGVERPGAGPAAPASSGAGLDRFSPPPPPQLELAAKEAGERPFTRCMTCGMDHHVFVTECSGCGASLETPAQREFNEGLWAARQAEAAEERRAAEERAAERARAGEPTDARRAMGEALAREVGDLERRRLDAEGFGGLGRLGGGAAPRVLLGAVGRGLARLWRRLAATHRG